MAVSKTQNERPAITALIDAVNTAEPIVAQNVQNIATLTQGLADEADARAQAVQAEATAREQAVQNVQNQIGEGTFSSSYTITQAFQQAGVNLLGLSDEIDNLNSWKDHFKLGITQQFTVAPNDSHTGTVTFDSPFVGDAQVLVLPNCVGHDASFGTLECKLVDATYSGFSFEVSNSDSDSSYTISVGYVAVQVN